SGVITPPTHSAAGPADSAAVKEAARLINQAKRPVVLLGLLASKPENAAAIHELIASRKLPVVGTFQAAGAISANLFSSFLFSGMELETAVRLQSHLVHMI